MTATGASFRRRIFVVMPFGKRSAEETAHRLDRRADGQRRPLQVDFDDVYQMLFRPALEEAGLQPFRADDEESAGDILKDMFAELVTADFVLCRYLDPQCECILRTGHPPYRRSARRDLPACRLGEIARLTSRRNALSNTTGSFSASVSRGTPRGKHRSPLRFRVWVRHCKKAVAADRTTEGSPVYGNLPKLIRRMRVRSALRASSITRRKPTNGISE